MKRNAYIAAALLFAGFTACNSEPAFKVQGEVTDAADKMLYLEQTGLDGIVALDSVELGSDGAFSFAAARPEAPDFYRLRIDNKVINFSQRSTIFKALKIIRKSKNWFYCRLICRNV